MPLSASLDTQQTKALTYPVPLRILHGAHQMIFKIVVVHLGLHLVQPDKQQKVKAL